MIEGLRPYAAYKDSGELAEISTDILALGQETEGLLSEISKRAMI